MNKSNGELLWYTLRKRVSYIPLKYVLKRRKEEESRRNTSF